MSSELTIKTLSALPELRAMKRDSAANRRADGAADAGEPAGPAAPPRAAEAEKLDLERLAPVERRLNFRVDEQSGRTVVSIVDAKTDEVIKQIPAEEMLQIAREIETQLREQFGATGWFVADRA